MGAQVSILLIRKIPDCAVNGKSRKTEGRRIAEFVLWLCSFRHCGDSVPILQRHLRGIGQASFAPAIYVEKASQVVLDAGAVRNRIDFGFLLLAQRRMVPI